MSRSHGLKAFLAALCLSAIAMDSAFAQAETDPAPASQSETDVQAGAPSAVPDGSQPGWLLRGRTPGVGQNRMIVNPFRATPGTRALRNPGQPGLLPPASGGAAAVTPQLPANAVPNAPGQGSCSIGFRRQGTTCVAVQIPENGSLDLTGHGWMCNRGFQRQQQNCLPVVLPENASLDATGRRWACDYGFRRLGQACVAVDVPEHASLDKAGHSWVCNQGYERRDQGCIDDATARLQQQADKAVNARPGGTAQAAPRSPVTVNSGENRQGRTSKAKVVIGRF